MTGWCGLSGVDTPEGGEEEQGGGAVPPVRRSGYSGRTAPPSVVVGRAASRDAPGDVTAGDGAGDRGDGVTGDSGEGRVRTRGAAGAGSRAPSK